MTVALPSLTQMLDRLIRHPSVSSTRPDLDMGNRAVIDELAGWLDDLGFAITVQPLNENNQKANLVARLGEGDGGLIFSGHTDTVPFDADLWLSDPFVATRTDEGYRGLGSTDMKGFFAVLLESIGEVALPSLKQPLTIVATADEESSFAGARQLEQLHLPARAGVIIGEPTDMQPVVLHKGIMMESIRIKGVAGHSSNPGLGINAIEVMREVLGQLLEFRSQLQQKYQHPGFSLPVPTLNMGCIHGGDNPNRICSHCELQFDLRSVPGMQSTELQHAIDKLLQPLSLKWQAPVERISLLEPVEAFEQQIHCDLVEQVTRVSNTQPRSVAFATEAPFYQQLGLDTLIWGPGSINQAHQANEYISHEQISQGIKQYRQLIEQFCL